jgi:16S rRNA (cytidine1402-2'-O)-methyltransferase
MDNVPSSKSPFFSYDANRTLEQTDLQAGIYLVATPLGNLKDITLRALEVLNAVDLILCEDTRVSRKLLSHYGISTPVKSFHAHNERKMISFILERLQLKQRIALISDAGTPLISDPGYKLVNEVHKQGFYITAIPGPCALINALILSGLSSEHFFFFGFLPSKSSERLRELEKLKEINATLIFYDSPQRLRETLKDLQQDFSERIITVVREMTKKFEEIIKGSLEEVNHHFASTAPRGEIVLLISPPSEHKQTWDEELLEKGLREALKNLSLKEAVEEITHLSGISRKIVYKKALKIQE